MALPSEIVIYQGAAGDIDDPAITLIVDYNNLAVEIRCGSNYIDMSRDDLPAAIEALQCAPGEF